MGRLGLGAEACRRLNPRLIHASLSGYGHGGPYEQKKAYDLLLQCETGLLSVTGTEDAPAKVGISVADICAGSYLYSGVLLALLRRGRTGEGSRFEVSMLEALGEWMSQPAYYARYAGVSPRRAGAQHATIAPYGPFPTATGTVFLAVQNEREWERLCTQVLRTPQLTDDPHFASNTERVANRDRTDAAVAAATAALAPISAPAPKDTLDVIADRPFWYFITDTDGRIAPLFAGRIGNPANKKS